jgi:hypothetical protein
MSPHVAYRRLLVFVHGGSEQQVLRAPETAGFGREEQSGPALLLVVRLSSERTIEAVR